MFSTERTSSFLPSSACFFRRKRHLRPSTMLSMMMESTRLVFSRLPVKVVPSGNGGIFSAASIGDEWQSEESQLVQFAIFSFEMEGWVAGDTYRLFLSELKRQGTPLPI